MCKNKFDLDIPENERVITIDLLTNKEGGVSLIQIKKQFELPNVRGWFGQRRFNKGTYRAIIKPEESVGIKFSKNPLLCSFLQADFAQECHFSVHGERFLPFSIAIDTRVFVDFPEVLTEDKIFELPFTIDLENLKGEKMLDCPLKDNLIIKAIAFRSAVDISYHPASKAITYKRFLPNENALCEVGILHVAHNGRATCAPAIHAIKLHIDTSSHNTDTNIGGFCTTPGHNEHYHTSDRHIEIPILPAGETIDIPIFWDMSQINFNPLDNSTSYNLSIRHNEISKIVGNLNLLRDNTVTEPDVRIVIANEQKHLFRSAKKHQDTYMPQPIRIAYTPNGTIRYDGQLIFENLAQADNNNESIGIWDFHTDVRFVNPADSKRLKLKADADLQKVITIDACSDFIHLKPRDNKILPIHIESGLIQSIEPNAQASVTDVDVLITLTYRLYVDLQGSHYLDFESGKMPNNALCQHPYENKIYIKLKKQPNPEWMCVDFGTSAIVAGISDSNHQINYINLKQIKDRLLTIAYSKDENRRLNDDEQTPFIASTLCLNPNYFTEPNQLDYRYITPDATDENKTVADYLLYPIWFSPGVGIIHREFQIPCLKTIVGYKEMPNIFQTGNEYIKKWKFASNNQHIALVQTNPDDTLEMSELLQISTLFQLVYKQLFIHYLKAQHLPNNHIILRQINQLVLTVPNTYTPYNIEMVRKIARATMPSLYPEYLTIVSESDAVACYYLLHRPQFFVSDIMTQERRRKMEEKEVVLVYDMGAGTLDLTLFSIERLQTTDKTKIDIKRKMGVNIAGNYLDYTLAEILTDIYSQSENKTEPLLRKLKEVLILDKGDAIARNITSKERNEIKKYVKELKKHLNDPDYILPTLYFNNDSIDWAVKSSDIIQHTKFNDFIHAVTERVLNNFVGIDEDINIDTVIFSGRSTELLCIRDGVKKALTTHCANADDILYANICNNQFYQTNRFEVSKEEHDNLKKVVTEGALAFADRYNRQDGAYQFLTRANYATFGIVTCDINDKYTWYPLISKGQVWDKTGIIKSEKISIDTRGLLWLKFIQTYNDREEEVIADYEQGRFDMISSLLTITNPYQNYGHCLDVQLNYNNQTIAQTATSALTLSLNGTTAEIQPHEDFDDIELRKSLWPVIF